MLLFLRNFFECFQSLRNFKIRLNIITNMCSWMQLRQQVIEKCYWRSNCTGQAIKYLKYYMMKFQFAYFMCYTARFYRTDYHFPWNTKYEKRIHRICIKTRVYIIWWPNLYDTHSDTWDVYCWLSPVLRYRIIKYLEQHM